jgi:hypothetical protein
MERGRERGELSHGMATRRPGFKAGGKETRDQRPLTSGRSACCQAAMPPSSQYTCSKPAFFRRLAAAAEAWPLRHTTTTGSCLAAESSLFSGSNWLGARLRLPAIWPFSKSALAGRQIHHQGVFAIDQRGQFGWAQSLVAAEQTGDLGDDDGQGQSDQSQRQQGRGTGEGLQLFGVHGMGGCETGRDCRTSREWGMGNGEGDAAFLRFPIPHSPFPIPYSRFIPRPTNPAIPPPATSAWLAGPNAILRDSAGCVRPWCAC